VNQRRRLFRFVALVVLSGAACLSTLSVRAVQTLPVQLSDEAFRRMIEEFSEDGGAFPSENFLSNESGYQFVLRPLQAVTRKGGVYIGVGPEQNFTYVVGLEPRIAFIVDIRRQNMIQHLMYKAAFEKSDNRADFLSRLFSRRRPAGLSANSTVQALFDAFDAMPPDPEFAAENFQSIHRFLVEENMFSLTSEDEQVLGHVFDVFSRYGPRLSYSSNVQTVSPTISMPSYAELMTLDDGAGVNRSYLASEENFRLVREMQLKNLIVPVVGNFAGPRAIRAIGEYVRNHAATVTVFYVSNVEQYLFLQGVAGEFYENVATLPLDASSVFIRTTNGRAQPTSMVGAREFESILGPMMELIRAIREGVVQGYLDILKIAVP
jgi:hypothetical protein